MKTSKRQPPKLQWPRLAGRFKYPLVEVGSARSVPLRPLATTIGCTFESLVSALSQLSRTAASEATYCRDDGRLSRSPAVAEHSLDYLLYAWRGQRGRSQIGQLRQCARGLALDALLSMAPALDQAKVMNEVLHFQLEIEKQKVADRDRQIENLKASRPGVALVNSRWESPATKEKFLEVAELHRQGIGSAEIGKRVSLSKAVVDQFLKGTYRTTAASAAYADLQNQRSAGKNADLA